MRFGFKYVVAAGAGAWMAAGLSYAQNDADEPGGPQATHADVAGPQTGANAEDLPSELDALSRRADEELGDIEANALRKPVSVTVRALDKVTAKYTDIEIDMGATASFGSLEITARFCDQRPPEEFPETTAFLQIFDRGQTVSAAAIAKAGAALSRQSDGGAAPATSTSDVAPADGDEPVFSGWMYASSPALNALEHPVYDVWVIDCKTVVEES